MRVNVNKPVIGFSGYAGVGKDTAYEMINKLFPAMLFQRVAFADKLKKDLEPCIKALKEQGFDVVNNREQKELFRDLYVEWSKIAKRFKPMFWVDRVDRDIREWSRRGNKVVITDCRYHFEIEYVSKMLKGLPIYIERPGVGPANKEEEESFALIFEKYPDLIKNKIINDGSKEELGIKVLERINEVFHFPPAELSCCPICHTNIFQKLVKCSVCGEEVCVKCSVYNAPKKKFTCQTCRAM